MEQCRSKQCNQLVPRQQNKDQKLRRHTSKRWYIRSNVWTRYSTNNRCIPKTFENNGCYCRRQLRSLMIKSIK